METKTLTVGELVEATKTMYRNAKLDKLNPVSKEWTNIISPFTKGIRVRITLGDPESFRLKYLLLYLHRLNRMLRFRNNKKMRIEFKIEQNLAARMKKIVQTGRWKGKVPYDPSMEEINSIIFQG